MLRLVLDTNVWLDWLVFDDPSVRALTHAYAAGALELLATDAMHAEFCDVIARPQFGLPEPRRRALEQSYRARTRRCPSPPDCRLPCTDRDDQCFIDLAVACRVDWLLSRDRALLRLRRLAAKRFGLRIATPAQWAAGPIIDVARDQAQSVSS
jgi:uncharacterized protein